MGFFSSLFGGGDNDGPKQAPQFNPDVKRLGLDIKNIRRLGNQDPSRLRHSANIQLDQLSEDKKQLLGELAKQNQGQLTGSFDRLATQGGLSGGASERLAKQSNRDSLFAQQKTGAGFAGLASNVRAGDFRDQESLKNRALFATPGLEAGKAGTLNQAGAANMNAKALFDANKRANKKSAVSSLFSLGGGIAAGIYSGGNPYAISAGASAGGAIANL